MRIEVLTVPDCPHTPLVAARLAEALGGRGDVRVAWHEVADDAQAARLGMHGSPTVLVDGTDPFAAPGTPTGYACRIYRAADGTSDGAPSVAELRRVLGG
jgi:hypothetical protein